MGLMAFHMHECVVLLLEGGGGRGLPLRLGPDRRNIPGADIYEAHTNLMVDEKDSLDSRRVGGVIFGGY